MPDVKSQQAFLSLYRSHTVKTLWSDNNRKPIGSQTEDDVPGSNKAKVEQLDKSQRHVGEHCSLEKMNYQEQTVGTC